MKATTRLAIATHAILAIYFVSTAVIVTTLSGDDVPNVTIQRQVVLGDEKKLMTTFIDQLLTKESAKCFKALLMKESSMNSRAKNPTSSASGVGQLLSSTYKNIGMRHSDDAIAQTVASMAYVARRWGGNYCKALAHQQLKGWY